MVDPWAAIRRILPEVAAIVAVALSVVEKLMRATHGTDTVGVTNRPVASPASEVIGQLTSRVLLPVSVRPLRKQGQQKLSLKLECLPSRY